MKKKKLKVSGRFIVLAIGAILTLAAVTWFIGAKISWVRHLDGQTYLRIKASLTEKGTRLSTVKMVSESGRLASGTLIKSSDVVVIITVAHYFAKEHRSEAYSYIIDGVAYPIHRVFSHPKPGPLGERDIAFCFPGASRKIKSYAEIVRDTGYRDLEVSGYSPLKVTKLEGNTYFEIGAILFRDQENPLYLIKYYGRDGESGSGLIGQGRFFVLKGNIPVGSDKIAAALELPPATKFSVLTEL